jgi:hypothetical protein
MLNRMGTSLISVKPAPPFSSKTIANMLVALVIKSLLHFENLNQIIVSYQNFNVICGLKRARIN